MWRRLLCILALCALPLASALSESCLDYGPANFSGILVRQTLAGPPDYESVTKGDAPIVVYVLQLDRLICVRRADGGQPRTVVEREVQLMFDAERLRDLLGRRLSVTGTLIPGGARHDRRLALEVSEISPR